MEHGLIINTSFHKINKIPSSHWGIFAVQPDQNIATAGIQQDIGSALKTGDGGIVTADLIDSGRFGTA